MTNLSTKIGDLKFEFPVFNAAGLWAKTKEDFESFARSEAEAILAGSCTNEPREGNPEPHGYLGNSFTLNSVGLANTGVDEFVKTSHKVETNGKPFLISVSGFSIQDYIAVVTKVDKGSFDGIEVNLSCPNVEGKGIFAYDIDTSLKLTKKLRALTKKSLGIKLSPYTQRLDAEKMAKGLLTTGVDFVTLINTYPMGAAIDIATESLVIKPNGGLAGIGGGPTMKAISLAQIILFRQFTNGKLPLIGVGGVESGKDVYEYILAGASAVQIASGIWREGIGIFRRIKKELIALLEQKGVENLESKIGSLSFI